MKSLRTTSLLPLPAASGAVSVAELESAAGLPPGAWARRRLYALKVRGNRLRPSELLDQDLCIVEPGERLRPHQLVVVRVDGRAGLRRIADDGRSQLDVGAAAGDVLPFPLEHAPVVGTVIAVLRRVPRSGRLELARGWRRASTPAVARVAKARRRLARAHARLDTAAALESRLANWHAWVNDQAACRDLRPGDATWQRWTELSSSLAALIACLRATSGHRFYDALADEIRLVLARMKEEAGAGYVLPPPHRPRRASLPLSGVTPSFR